MIYRCEFYLLDCGRQYKFCPLKITAPPSVIPQGLLTLLSPASLGYCLLPVNARHVKMTMANGEIFLIEYPFPAFLPDWTMFWQDLQQNPTIIKLEGIGESILDNLLRSYLFS